MATYMDVDRVQYKAESGVQAPLCRLYFCRYCLKLRSTDCVSNEVDSHYCPNCLENMPSAEAKMKKHRCANCFDCPSCRHTLSTRATSVAVPHPDDASKTIPKKVYYLACAFCRWTSRDVGLKDQPVASGGWQAIENPHDKRIAEIMEYYRQLAQKEKADKERKKYTRRRSYLRLSDKYGLTSVVARKRQGLTGMGNLSLKDEEATLEPAVAEAAEDVEALPEDIFTAPVVLEKVSNISQRLAAPVTQPELTVNLYPMHKHLLIKKSQRCRECQHNLSKPEFNPQSIKFKIQLAALFHVPEVRIMHQLNLTPHQQSQVILTLCNPLDNNTDVILLPSDKEEDLDYNTAKLELPTCELQLAKLDDTAVYDEGAAQAKEIQDDPSVVVFRKGNKIGFFIKVTPEVEEGDVKVCFLMQYDYKQGTAALHSEATESKIVRLHQYVYVNLGAVASA